MLPTIRKDGELVAVNNFSYNNSPIFRKLKECFGLHRQFHRGDVIISTCPYDSNKNICKRIVALEGDTIVNRIYPFKERIIVPKGHVWLAGDNPSNSTDSRMYGPVPLGLIQGKLIWKLTGNFDLPKKVYSYKDIFMFLYSDNVTYY